MEKLTPEYPTDALAEALEVSESGFAAHRRKAQRPRRQHDEQLRRSSGKASRRAGAPTAVRGCGSISRTAASAAAKIASPGSCGRVACGLGRSGASLTPSIAIKGSIIGGDGTNITGAIVGSADIGKITVGGDVRAGSAGTGLISTTGRIGSLTIGGDLVTSLEVGTSSAISANRGLGSLKIGGSIIGHANDIAQLSFDGGGTILGSLLVGGNVEFASIHAVSISADNSIGKITVGGDWIASRISLGTNPGADTIYGTNDDTFTNDGSPETVGKLGSLTIKGKLLGTVGGPDSFRIMAPKIGTLKVGEVLYPLTVGIDNFGIGATGDSSIVDRA